MPATARDFAPDALGVLRTTVGAVVAEHDAPGHALQSRARELGVSLDATLSTAADDDDVAWSSNEWCLSRPGVIEAADIVVTRDGTAGPEVLCIRRSHPPFASTWALPGGLRDAGEGLAETADRELVEETGIDAVALGSRRWLGELEATDWDPRAVGSHVGAVWYHADTTVVAAASDDAVDAQWIPVSDIAAGRAPMAFGHAHWLAVAYADDDYLGAQLDSVAEAGRRRNRRIITKVNEARRRARRDRPDVAEIPLAAVRGSWAREQPLDAFAAMSTDQLAGFVRHNHDATLRRRAAAALDAAQRAIPVDAHDN